MIQENKPVKFESGPPVSLNSGNDNRVLKLESGENEPATFSNYKGSSKAQKYEIKDIPDAKEEDFRSGCCGKTPVTYESEEKKKTWC